MREIEIGKLYKHFKNKLYQVVDIVNDSESNNDEYYRKIVVYKALYGDGITWARDYDMFNSEVDHEKYPDVEQKYRFEEYYRDYSTGINAFVIGAIDTELEESLKELNMNIITKDDSLDMTLQLLKTSDIVIVNDENIDNFYVGYAYSNNVPIYLITKKDIDTLNEVIEKVISYNDVSNEFKRLMDNNELKTNINTFKK